MVLTTSRDSRLLLRKTEGIREWQRSIETLLAKEKQKHREMQSTNDFWNRKQFSDCHNAASQWLLVRDNIGKICWNDQTWEFYDVVVHRSQIWLPQQNESKQFPFRDRGQRLWISGHRHLGLQLQLFENGVSASSCQQSAIKQSPSNKKHAFQSCPTHLRKIKLSILQLPQKVEQPPAKSVVSSK